MTNPDDSELVTVLAEFGEFADSDWRVDHVRTLNNAVWSVAHDNENPVWALRRHRAGWRSPGAIAAELELLEFLHRRSPAAISVPRPVSSVAGDRLVEAGGALYSVLSWVPGTVRRPLTGLGEESAWLLGRALGWIHSATDAGTVETPIEWTAERLFAKHPGLMGADIAGVRRQVTSADWELFEEIADRTAAVFAQETDWGVIHADYILGNCRWTSAAGGQPEVGILDFDDFGHGARLFDLGAVLGNLADFPDSWGILAPRFLAGYRSAHRLPREAEEHLPLMMAARHASQCLWVLGHPDMGPEWVATHLTARMEMARDCLAAAF